MKGWILAFTILLAGCSAMSAGVSRSVSEFDGTTQILMQPGWASFDTKIGLMWNSKMPQGNNVLTIMVRDRGGIATGESLHFNIDGEIVDLESFDAVPQVEFQPAYYSAYYSSPSATWASKRYDIETATLEKIANAQKTVFKVDLGREYIEGTLIYQPSSALWGLKGYLAEKQKQRLTAHGAPVPE